MALQSMNVVVDNVFACDNARSVQRTIQLNYAPKFFFSNISGRDVDNMPIVDLYHAGFPCQPFSMAGKKLGIADPLMRGVIINDVLLYIETKLPKVVLLENVKGLVTMHRDTLQGIEDSLAASGYNVEYRVMQSSAHGVPQNRERLIIVGIHGRSCAWQWPPPLPLPKLMTFLDPATASEKTCDLRRRLPSLSQKRARAHVRNVLRMCDRQGIDIRRSGLIVDIDGSKVHMMSGVSPCLTRTRAANGGHWILCRGRRMSIKEMERLMGVGVTPPSGGKPSIIERPATVSARQWGSIIGNSIPVPLLQRILCRVLPAAGFYTDLPDLWSAQHP
ncbi:MAG: DNA (cytosine-5-)-methyltransferase [Planctomycetaceae bacterium]|nr:DNA (cytosine-5-)-methyltransferase [Planctomycetaceae bacterium]